MARRTSNCLWRESNAYEPFHKVDLEGHDSHDQQRLQDGPPFDTRVGALCCISVDTLTHGKVFLLILEQLNIIGKVTKLSLSGDQTFFFRYNTPCTLKLRVLSVTTENLLLKQY